MEYDPLSVQSKMIHGTVNDATSMVMQLDPPAPCLPLRHPQQTNPTVQA